MLQRWQVEKLAMLHLFVIHLHRVYLRQSFAVLKHVVDGLFICVGKQVGKFGYSVQKKNKKTEKISKKSVKTVDICGKS